MDAKQAAVYGIFAGMAIIDEEEKDEINMDKIHLYATKILTELGHPLPSEQSLLDFTKFLNQLNSLCSDILLK